MLAGAVTELTPEFGFELLLPIFAAVVLGGIGDAVRGACRRDPARRRHRVVDAVRSTRAGSPSVGFVVLMIVLIIRPQGIFGKAKSL